MVAHVLRLARLGGVASGAPHHPAPKAPPHPPCGPPRDVLLHDHRLAELAAREDPLLGHPGGRHRDLYRLQAPSRRPQVVPEGLVREDVFDLLEFCTTNFVITCTLFNLIQIRNG